MRWCDDKRERLARDRVGTNAAHHTVGEKEAQIDRAGPHLFDHFVDGADAGDNTHVGVTIGKSLEPPRQELRRNITMHRNGDLARRSVAQIRKRICRLLGLAQDLDRIGIDGFTGFGELRLAAARAMKQRLAHLGFERLDMRTDRRLRNAELLRRKVEAAVIDDALEHGQPARTRGDHGNSTVIAKRLYLFSPMARCLASDISPMLPRKSHALGGCLCSSSPSTSEGPSRTCSASIKPERPSCRPRASQHRPIWCRASLIA